MWWFPVSFSNWGGGNSTLTSNFPNDPCEAGARFEFRAGPSRPVYSIDPDQLVRLVAEAGEELVGLCYFGDQPSRENIEARLALKGSRTDS